MDRKADLNITGAIFDVDGTILDSMPTWHNSGLRYLAGLGIEGDPNLGDILFTHTSETGARYLIDRYGLDGPEYGLDQETVAAGLAHEMEHYYFEEASIKDGAVELLDRFKEVGIPMTVATSTDRYCIDAAFENLGLTKYFDRIITCPEVGATKSEPLIFYEAAKTMGTDKESTWVFEDGLYAIETAAKAGFRTAAVYDQISESDFARMKELADISLTRLDEFLEY